jgi:co-chaperonin GroES (HSP10)
MSSEDEDSNDEVRKQIRHIQPLGMRVLVRLVKDDGRSASGLYLPEGVAEKHQDALYGEVIEVARAESDEESLGANVSGVPAGAFVLFGCEEGVSVPWDSELRILESQAILAVVEEVAYDSAH